MTALLSTKRLAVTAATALALSAFSGMALAETTLTIESWRNDDADIWNSQIIPAFEKQHPDIKVTFSAVEPQEYDAALGSKLEPGTAGGLAPARHVDKAAALL